MGLGMIALALRLAPLLRGGTGWALANVDSPRYVNLANGLRAGCGFAQLLNGHCQAPEVLRTPGYPLFLAMMPGLRAAVAVQAFIGAGLCVAIGFFLDAWWGLAAGAVAEALLTFDLPTIVQSSRILSDVLFQALLAAAMILQLMVVARGMRDRKALAAIFGAASVLGAAIFVRPVGVLLPLLAPLPLLCIPRSDWKKTMALCLATFAIPAGATAGWMARNAACTGVWTLSSDIAIDLYYFKAGGVVWYRSDGGFVAAQNRLARAIGLPNASDYPDTPVTLQNEMLSRALRIFIRYPAATLIMTARCMAWLAIVPDRGSLNELLGTHGGAASYLAATSNIEERIRQLLRSPLLTVLVVLQLMLNSFVWLGIARVLVGLRGKSIRHKAFVLIPLGVALAMMATAAGAEAYARYRMPAIPMLVMLAGIGWSGQRMRTSAQDVWKSAPKGTQRV